MPVRLKRQRMVRGRGLLAKSGDFTNYDPVRALAGVVGVIAMLRQVTPRLLDKVLENGFDPVATLLVRTTHRLRDIKVVVQSS
jgi:hypothetical protein